MTLADNGLCPHNNWGFATAMLISRLEEMGTRCTTECPTGVINGQITTSKNNGGSSFINDGTINIDKTNNVAMFAHGSAKMVNNGTINVGTVGTTQNRNGRDAVGIRCKNPDAVIENNGTINIYASNSTPSASWAATAIFNNGTVYITMTARDRFRLYQQGR